MDKTGNMAGHNKASQLCKKNKFEMSVIRHKINDATQEISRRYSEAANDIAQQKQACDLEL
jgi:hypothetical protein